MGRCDRKIGVTRGYGQGGGGAHGQEGRKHGHTRYSHRGMAVGVRLWGRHGHMGGIASIGGHGYVDYGCGGRALEI